MAGGLLLSFGRNLGDWQKPHWANAVRLLASSLLIWDAYFKFKDQWTQRSLGIDTGMMTIAIVEFAIGIWTITRITPELNHLILVGCFLGFFNIALWKAISGARSCDCFGSAIVNPWLIAILDAMIVLGLIAVKPRSHPSAWPFQPWSGVGISTFIGCLLMGGMAITLLMTFQGTGQVRRIVNDIVASANENDKRLGLKKARYIQTVHNLKFQHPVEMVEKKGKSVSRLVIFPKVETEYDFYVFGSEVRREKKGSQGTVRDVTIARPNGALFYDPEKKQAWLYRLVDSEPTPVDPRTWVFQTPCLSFQDWIAGLAVKKTLAMEAGLVEIHVRDVNGKAAELTFPSHRLHAPSRVLSRNVDGSINRIATANYWECPESGATLPDEVVIDLYGGNDLATQNPKVASRVTWKLAKCENVASTDPQLFSPELPPGVRLTSPSMRVRAKKNEPIQPFAVIPPKVKRPTWTGLLGITLGNTLLVGAIVIANYHKNRRPTRNGD